MRSPPDLAVTSPCDSQAGGDQAAEGLDVLATQPLLPLLSHDFHVTAAESTLTLALSTATLALGLLPAGWLADSGGELE